MNSYRTLRIYGHKTPDAEYTVTVNDQLVCNGIEDLFSFSTDTSVHGSADIVISVESGSITLSKCIATYPATFNNVEGTVTFIQPIKEPVAVIRDGKLSTIPFAITVNQGEQFSYKHLMFNGPTRINLTVKNIDVTQGMDVYLGNFLKNEFHQCIVNFEPEYRYERYPNELTTKDLELLKEFVYKATVMKLVYMTDLKSVAVRHGGSSPPSRTNHRRNYMSKQEDILNKAYGNVPKEIGYNADWSILPGWRGVRYYWYKLIRKITR